MQSKSWDELQPNEKADVLRRDFEEFSRIERENVQARADRHSILEKRVTELEEALKRMQSHLAQP
jgi:hypothetical protein